MASVTATHNPDLPPNKQPPPKALARSVAINHKAPASPCKTLNTSIWKLFYGNEMDTVTVSPKFQVVIPQSVRDRVGIKPGERMVVMERGNVIYLVRLGSARDAKGFLGRKISTEGLRDEGERFG